MGTLIEWTDETWNPIVGCGIVSPGCTNCYAMRAARRLANNPATPHYAGAISIVNGNAIWTGKVALAEHKLTEPDGWRRPRKIFVNSMGDLFHEAIPDEWIDRVFAVMARCPQHVFQILTKRPVRMRDYAATHEPVLPNVWLGTSAERQQEADERIQILLQTSAAVRFASCEPLLGPIDLALSCGRATPRGGLAWIIVGGESGPKARPMNPQWARDLRDQCHAAGIAFFMKQMAKKAPIPGDLLIREYPSRQQFADTQR